MNSQQDVIYGLMNELEEALDKGFPLLGPSLTIVKKDTVVNILDRLYAALPDEIKEARALLRRKDTFTGDVLSFGDIMLDRDSLELIKGDKKIALGKKEFQILEMLILNEGKSIDKEKFIEKIWGYDTDAEYNTIEVYVSFLRKKLLAVGAKTEIKSIRGIGYTLIGINKWLNVRELDLYV